jgi:MFS family permease
MPEPSTVLADPAGQPARTPVPTATGWVLGALVAPGALGISAIGVVLPAVSAELALSSPQAAWLLAGYLVAQATFVGVFGRLGDLRGGRTVLLAGAALVAAGSLLAALSASFPALLGGRLLQGAGGGALFVSAYAIIAARFAGAERMKVVAILTASLGIISGSGTLIGGLLADETSWRVVIALPALALFALAATTRLAPAPSATAERIDVVGAVLLAVLASSIVLLLETPGLELPTGIAPGLAVVTAATAIQIACRIRRVPEGFVPAAVVRSPRFVLGALAALTLFASYLAILFAAPLLLLREHDWTLTQVGLTLWPAALMGALSARLAGRLIGAVDPFRLAAGGAALASLGLLLATFGNGGALAIALALALVQVGFSGGQVALVARVPLAVKAEVRSAASGLFTFAFWLGGALGTAVVAGLAGPLGLEAALAGAAALPAAGALLALAAGTALEQRRQATPRNPGASRMRPCARSCSTVH